MIVYIGFLTQIKDAFIIIIVIIIFVLYSRACLACLSRRPAWENLFNPVMTHVQNATLEHSGSVVECLT